MDDHALQPEPAPLEAVTISRDVQEFDLLIEDMEAELGEAWGDLTFEEAAEFLRQDEARRLSFVVVAVDHADEGDMARIAAVVKQAKRAGLQVILVADGLGPMVLHELLRAGADDFAPYPLPEHALAEAISHVRSPRAEVSPAMAAAAEEAGLETAAPPAAREDASAARVFAFQGVAGGAGASTIAVNLAWEMATARKGEGPSVCLIDLGLQFGSVATYTDLSRKDNIYEILSDTDAMDEQAFRQSLQLVRDKVWVFTAPAELLPLDLIGPDDVRALLALARKCFDVVVIDAPAALTQWTDTVISESDRFFFVSTLEVRAAQNAMRLIRLMKSEGIDMSPVGWVLNRAPGRGDLASRGRADKLAEMLDVRFDAVLPDGGKAVTEANDQAQPLAAAAPKAPVRREIAALAGRLAAAGALNAATPAPKGRKVFGIKFG
ncbi:AAA family ATPase [Jannaschia sp. W003]|uniref:AAA family ATPase n=1 Tax=Jannaschia sp. W003 TaxID=2867012 RepID=UPI0021A5FE20|nr:AAA family ATPase [Jannaschia sp. W003]UWQ22918.1 AAA family ATPase [Jannaschia sp. W003]